MGTTLGGVLFVLVGVRESTVIADRDMQPTDHGLVAEIQTMWYLMSRGELIVRGDDPFPGGFSI